MLNSLRSLSKQSQLQLGSQAFFPGSEASVNFALIQTLLLLKCKSEQSQVFIKAKSTALGSQAKAWLLIELWNQMSFGHRRLTKSLHPRYFARIPYDHLNNWTVGFHASRSSCNKILIDRVMRVFSNKNKEFLYLVSLSLPMQTMMETTLILRNNFIT